MPNDKAFEERRMARASIASDLHIALCHLQRARARNAQLALGLDLPAEQPFNDALKACADAHRKETLI